MDTTFMNFPPNPLFAVFHRNDIVRQSVRIMCRSFWCFAMFLVYGCTDMFLSLRKIRKVMFYEKQKKRC